MTEQKKYNPEETKQALIYLINKKLKETEDYSFVKITKHDLSQLTTKNLSGTELKTLFDNVKSYFTEKGFQAQVQNHNPMYEEGPYLLKVFPKQIEE